MSLYQKQQKEDKVNDAGNREAPEFTDVVEGQNNHQNGEWKGKGFK
jgi:hypothetical protein